MEPLRWCDWREVCPCGTSRPSRRTLCVSPAGSPARVSRTGATPRPLETASNPRGSAPPRQGGRAEPQPGSRRRDGQRQPLTWLSSTMHSCSIISLYDVSRKEQLGEIAFYPRHD